MEDDSKIAGKASLDGAIITPRSGPTLTPEEHEARERETFERFVIQAAERAASNVADQRRYTDLMRDRRTVRARLSEIEAEIKEIENRRPRKSLKTS